MPKLIMLPPQSARTRRWADALTSARSDYTVALPESDEAAVGEITDADAAFGRVSPEVLSHAGQLRWLQSPAAAPQAGFYHQALIDHPVQVCNPRGVFNDHIAQHILMYALALARGLPQYAVAQRERRWDKDARTTPYIELSGATVLIVGVGGIGQETARLFRAFGSRVIGLDARWEYDVEDIERHGIDALEASLPSADFVVVTVPHTPETEGMWNADLFALMKASAFFINIGRGMTTRLDDLADAVESGAIAGCALDVFETEPLPSDHRLWELPTAILTPHIAVKDADNVEDRMLELFLDNAARFADGRPLRNVVDKRVWH